MNGSAQPVAALFDYDGTLVDSSRLWFQAEAALVEHCGGSGWTPELSADIHGYSMPDGAQVCFEFAGRGGEGLDPVWGAQFMGERFLADLSATGLQWLPGALELLADLTRRGVRLALVSASAESILQAGIDTLPSNPFDVVVAGDQVTRGKPHPEPYATAASRLGLDPAQCIAFEDSPEGRDSAEAAGCFVVAINFHHPHEPAPGRMPVDTLEGLAWEGVVGEYERWMVAR